MIKLFKPYVSWRAVWNAVRTLRSGQLAEGPKVKELEEIIDLTHAWIGNHSDAVAFNSATSALEVVAEMLDLKSTDEVIIPVLTCAATAVPFARRCKVVFADVNNDLLIDLNDAKAKITKHTRAIVNVRFGGNDATSNDVAILAKKHGLVSIDDASQDFKFDSICDFAVISLQAIKTITAGDGGILLCQHKTDYDRAKRLRWFGLERGVPLDQQDMHEVGFKYHMNDIAASIALGNGPSYTKIRMHLDRLAEIYEDAGLKPSKWLCMGKTFDYNALKILAQLKGFEVGQHHYRLDKYSAFKSKGEFPNMDRLEGKYFFIPYHYGVSVRQAKRIARIVKPFLA